MNEPIIQLPVNETAVGQKAKGKAPETTKERFVAYFDIMGFKDRVMRNTHEKILGELDDLTNKISEFLPADDTITYAMFSDSIVLISNEDNAEDLVTLSGISQQIISYSIKREIPIKGAIAYGKMSVKQKSNLFFGQPLIDAYLLEESLKCYGVVAHNSLDWIIETNKDCQKFFTMRPVSIDGKNIEHYHLNNYGLESAHVKNIRKQVSGSPRIYIDNTLKLMQPKQDN